MVTVWRVAWYCFNPYGGSSSQFALAYLYDFDNGISAFNEFGSTGLRQSEVLIAPGDSGAANLRNGGTESGNPTGIGAESAQ